MGDEDSRDDFFENFDEPDWLSNTPYGYHQTPPDHSDIETWVIEKSIEAHQGSDKESINAKRELYLLKCKLDRVYDSLPKHPKHEREWDKQEVHRILKGGK